MGITPISRVKTITHRVGQVAGIEKIYETNLVVGNDYQPGYKIVSFNAFIKNLKVYASMQSLPEVELPSFAPTDTSTQKTMKVLDVEWGSPRKQMDIYIASNDEVVPQWYMVGSVSFLNPYRYPFRIYNLMDLFTDNLALELGENSRIGVQMVDVGFGTITTQDSVIVHGSYTEEMFLYSEDKLPINNYTFEIRNINTGGSNNTGGGTAPPTGNNNLMSNSSVVGNSSNVGN